MMNIAIIGCGYTGSAIANHLRKDYVVTATTTSPERVAELEAIAHRVIVIRGDDPSLITALENQEAVILTLAPTSDQQVDAEGYAATYLDTAKNLVVLLQQSSVKQVIYTSSSAVYGNSNGEWVNEDSPTAPVNGQGEVLRDTEQVLLKLHQMNVCIFRLGGIYGSERELSDRFSDYAGKTIPGTGENFTNWSHLEDIVSAVEFALKNRLNGIYNLVSDMTLTSRELLDTVCEKQGLAKIQWDTLKAKARPNIRVSNQKLKAAGYQFIHTDLIF
jgi:nucleoside-diphosphate-sugar epimerase